MKSLRSYVSVVVLSGLSVACSNLNTQPMTPAQKTVVPSDSSISREWNAKLNNSTNFPDSNIYADVYKGTVLLTGQVKNQELVNYMLDVTRSYPGVSRIYNYTEIRLPVSFSVRSSDSVITSSIKALLFGNRDFPSKNVSVTTTNGIVYLMGDVTPEQGETAANKAALIGNVRKVITLFDYTSQPK